MGFRWPCSRITSNACRGSIVWCAIRGRRSRKVCKCLRRAKELRPDLLTKSSIMIGLGETDEEVTDAMRQLREANVDLLTLGQYLAPGRPGERFLPVTRFVSPRAFRAWADEAKTLGFVRWLRDRWCEAPSARVFYWKRRGKDLQHHPK